MKRAAFLVFLFCLLAPYAQAASITDLRIQRDGNQTRLTLVMDAKLPYRAFLLNNPARLVIDLPLVSWRAPLNKGDRNRIIKSYRKGVYQHDTTRLVLDLQRPATLASHQRIAPMHGTSWDYVFLLQPVDPVTFQKNINRALLSQDTPQNAVQNLSAPEAPEAPEPVSPATSATPAPTQVAKTPVKKPLIVIDAGHGGVDPGAHAVTGENEKNITLAVAQRVAMNLQQTGHYRVKLTRPNDIYIKLPERVAIARRAGADMFISLHADTIGRPLVHGASVYTLSDKASDAETAKLAERENAVDTLVNVDVGKVDADVADILIDLVTRDTMNQSKILAETVVDSFHDNGLMTLPERPHRSAGFAVLKAPDIPSILIEMGYLSNPQEAHNLSDDRHRKKIARAVTDTVERFFHFE